MSDGLAVFDIGGVACGATEHDDFANFVHIFFQFGVNFGIVGGREIAEVDADWRAGVDRADEVAVYIFSYKRHHGGGAFGEGYERGVEGHVGVDFILFHAFSPETRAGTAYVPVGKFVDEALERPCSFRNLVAG